MPHATARPSRPALALLALLAVATPAQEASDAEREAALRARAVQDAALVEQGVAGAAFFRHRLAEAEAELGEDLSPERAGWDTPWRPARGSVEDSFELFTGARALSENLALDRRLPLSDPAEQTVPLAEIRGVEVPPYDWAPLLADIALGDEQVDPLARLVPDDQYGLFFPDFASLMQVADHVQAFGAPVLELLEPRAVDSRAVQRIEQQLALPRDVLARTVGPQLVGSVAITGAGYELRTGTDLALLFEADDTAVLHKLLRARVREAARDVAGARVESGTVRGVSYELLTTGDRRLCSYLAVLGPAVVVTNSLPQLRRLAATWEGRRAHLATTPEYTFFRHRYPRGDAAESAFGLLPDAAIRRWCSPRWRIGASRVARARAGLLEVQARRLADLSAGQLSGSIHTPEDLGDLGRLRVETGLLSSEPWGSRDFATPVLELEVEAATEEEAALYERWREGYERAWRQVFDPVALRLELREGQLALDLSVRPLIADSDYQRMLSPVRSGSLAPHAGDPHPESIVHWVTAVDPDDPPLRSAQPVGLMRSLSPQLDPLAWMGGAFAVWIDADPFWKDFAAAEEPDEFLVEQLHRLPVALHADVRSGLALAGFLTVARATAEGSAPGMLLWETREHADTPYVRVGPSAAALRDMGFEGEERAALEQTALYYVASAEGLTLSFSEPLVRRAVERQVARREARAGAADAAATDRAGAHATPSPAAAAAGGAPAWGGEHLGLRVDVAALAEILEATPEAFEFGSLRELSWSNLPILDVWRSMFPDQDPVEVHARLWGERLVCPGGGVYRWNAADQAMESSVYGHPGRPLEGPRLPPAVHTVERASFGLSFEDDGLRARATLDLRP